jgi:hypothetical protein
VGDRKGLWMFMEWPVVKDKELFQKAIGMDPWVVVPYEFDPAKGRLGL